MSHTYTSQQLSIAADLEQVASICRSILSVLGPGTCAINQCEGCAVDHQEAVKLASSALATVTQLMNACQGYGIIP